jgi:hypothetical protein
LDLHWVELNLNCTVPTMQLAITGLPTLHRTLPTINGPTCRRKWNLD